MRIAELPRRFSIDLGPRSRSIQHNLGRFMSNALSDGDLIIKSGPNWVCAMRWQIFSGVNQYLRHSAHGCSLKLARRSVRGACLVVFLGMVAGYSLRISSAKHSHRDQAGRMCRPVASKTMHNCQISRDFPGVPEFSHQFENFSSYD